MPARGSYIRQAIQGPALSVLSLFRIRVYYSHAIPLRAERDVTRVAMPTVEAPQAQTPALGCGAFWFASRTYAPVVELVPLRSAASPAARGLLSLRPFPLIFSPSRENRRRALTYPSCSWRGLIM